MSGAKSHPACRGDQTASPSTSTSTVTDGLRAVPAYVEAVPSSKIFGSKS